MLSRTRNFALSTTRALPSIRRVDSHIPPNHHKEIHMRANRGEENEVEKVEIQQVLEEPRDFWEGEQWNILGEISSLALPIFVALALFVGIFAAQTYNQDADVFLDSPKSDAESAKLYKFE